jgi:regulator of protease activity HflC (stomatin/prohibitin superfamily)
MAREVTVSHNPIQPLRLGLGIVACIGIVVTLLTLLLGFKSIPANSVGVKTRFGAYHTIVNPGLA